ncbi:hypothetical protein [Raoultella planticola]|uniref:hypothetical protein n=1 Tax=Raoultella planticola TaxID=575 RepID=UPI0010D10AAE|nr:hypothetical protein [Raoultella planticola]VTM93331.1 Uncharacterised protein [Raoultella planticola]
MTNNQLTDDRLVKILSETQATIMEHNSRCVRGSVEVDARLFESMIMELQERRKAAIDSEPVKWINGCNKSVPAALRYLAENPRPIGGESSFNTAHLYQLAREIESMSSVSLYRHAQPAPEKYNIGDATMRHIFTPTGMTNVSDMQAVFDRVEAVFVGMEQPAPVVPDGLLSMAASAIEDLLEHTDPNTSYYSGVWADVPGKLRAAMIAAAPQDEAKKDKPHNNFGTGARLTNHRFKV